MRVPVFLSIHHMYIMPNNGPGNQTQVLCKRPNEPSLQLYKHNLKNHHHYHQQRHNYLTIFSPENPRYHVVTH